VPLYHWSRLHKQVLLIQLPPIREQSNPGRSQRLEYIAEIDKTVCIYIFIIILFIFICIYQICFIYFYYKFIIIISIIIHK